jgi:hypothetical protein
MRTATPDILPLFRSNSQARLLARLFLYPDKTMSVTELADWLSVNRATVQREAQRLESAGLVKRERVGRQFVIRANFDSLYGRELQSLLVKAFGPKALLERELSGISGIDQALVFGSWAERMLGTPGPPPNDVDVLVVGDPDRRLLARAVRAVSEEIEREVNPTVISSQAWAAPSPGFLESVKGGPLIPLEIAAQ